MLRWGKRDSVQDKWAPIAPSAPAGGLGGAGRFANVLKPSKPAASSIHGPMVGRWPESVLLQIVSYLPIPDLPAVARVNRSFARLVRDDRGWEARCLFLRLKVEPRKSMDTQPKKDVAPLKSPAKSARRKDSIDDDFGDFSNQNDVFEDVDFGDMGSTNSRNGARTTANGSGHGSTAGAGGAGAGAFNLSGMETNLMDFGDLPLPSQPAGSGGAKARTSGFFALAPPNTNFSRSNGVTAPLTPSSNSKTPGPYLVAYKAHHLSLLPLCQHVRTSPSPSSTLSLLFPPDPRTSLPLPLSGQAERLLTLLLFLSPRLQPLRDWGFLRQALLSAADRFDSTCLVAFEVADGRGDEAGMKAAAEASWNVWEAGGGSRDQWECGRVWVEKREVFYETGKWDALENIIRVSNRQGQTVRQLDFTPMDAFMSHVLETFRIDAELAVRIFPAQSRVVLSFCDRVASDVIGEYIQTLLGSARAISPSLYLQATPAAFIQASKLVDVASSVLSILPAATSGKPSAKPVSTLQVTRTQIEDTIFRMFETHMDEYLDEETEAVKLTLEEICRSWDAQLGEDTSRAARGGEGTAPTFLTASNPDQVKRNVLASFKDALLLPVTIVPRTVTFGVNAIVAGGNTAVSGLAMLNPQRWAGQGGARVVKQDDGDNVLFDIPTAGDEDEKAGTLLDEKRPSVITPSTSSTLAPPGTPRSGASRTPSGTRPPSAMDGAVAKDFDSLQMLVSLDTALELIQGDRDSLKRCETFAKYPAKCGQRVREAIEEIFVLLLKAAGDRHIAPGFRVATNQMSTYKPNEHAETTSVAPLLQFFELVHVGDTIQSMVQVYFDKELTPYVDKTDFLNTVMREKKRFEGILDDAVAGGLNAGIEVLMNQVEHIIITKTGPREYYPDEGAPLELGPTEGCRESVKCLEMHCNLLRGSTSKEVLEVFYQEVGIRLQQILQRHLKRQIISLDGGFQIIADLNTYHAFVATLKQQRVTEDFANLKMLGHVYIVSDAKDLAQIVRDVTRYGGTFRPEDIYEFIQRRADWKKIEKTVDKAMYALSVKDDCTIM